MQRIFAVRRGFRLDRVDLDLAGRDLNGLARAGVVHQLLARHLDRTGHRRGLHLLSLHGAGGGKHRIGGRNRRAGLGQAAGDIPGVADNAETEPRLIAFIVRREVLGRLDRPAHQHGEHAGRQRVERAGVPDLPDIVQTADAVDHIVRRPARRFVDDDNAAVKRFNLTHRPRSW